MTKSLIRAATVLALGALVWPLWAQEDPEDGSPSRDNTPRTSDGRAPMTPGTPGTPMPPRGDGRRPMQPMDPAEFAKQLTEAVAFYNDVDKSQAEELQKLAKSDDPHAREQAMRMVAEARELRFMKEQDPQRYESLLSVRKMENETARLGREYRDATPERQAAIKTELQAKLDKLFEAREADRQAEITRMEKELARLKEMVAKRRKNKAQIIETRIRDLTGERDETGW